MTQAYVRPPILEAVVEIRVKSGIDQDSMNKIEKRLKTRYPAPPQKTANISVEISDVGAHVRQDIGGFKILSADGSNTVSVTNVAIGTSAMPPYSGWESFLAEAQLNWADWKKVAGWKEIARIGLRYINRIDVPVPDGTEIDLADYLTFGVRRPLIPGFGAMTQFAVNTEIPMANGPLKLILNSSPTPSPLVKTASFLLDLDLSVDQELPQNDGSMWDMLHQFRDVKNAAFEACITDKTRSLLS